MEFCVSTKHINWLGGLLTLLAVVVLPAAGADGHEGARYPEYYAITARKIELGPTEGVYSFTLDTIGAEIVRTKVPILWNIAVDNSEGDRSHLTANAIVGAWAFRHKGLQFFDQFVEVAKENPNRAIPPPPFDIRLVVSITDDENGKERRVELPLERITLTQIAGP
jgi:hypothetical protein